MKQFTKNWGVVYFENTIVSVKTPENEVYPGKGRQMKEFDTQNELDTFINENDLSYEFTTENNG